MSTKLIVSSCDTGSANALAPVLAKLPCDYVVFAQKDAARIFDRWKIPYQFLDSLSWDDLFGIGNHILTQVRATAVVTGTSWGPSIDKALTLAARKHNLPCAALIEHWDLYLERFSVVKDGHIHDLCKFLPDHIWVNDTIALSEACSAGLPADALQIVGQPHLEGQLNLLRNRSHEPTDKGIVFISERVSEDFAPESPLYRGFDEFKALHQLLDSIDLSKSNVLVKLHPQEDINKFDNVVRGNENIEVVKEADNISLILNAKKLVGMFSMLLLEAALVRSDVISFLPGGNASIFIGNRVGATTPATTKEELKYLLDKSASESTGGNGNITAFGSRFMGSTIRMTETIQRLMA